MIDHFDSWCDIGIALRSLCYSLSKFRQSLHNGVSFLLLDARNKRQLAVKFVQTSRLDVGGCVSDLVWYNLENFIIIILLTF